MAALIADQAVHITVAAGSAATTATFTKGQRLGLISTTNCWVITGSAPTAAANTGVYVPAGVRVDISISADDFKVAAIQASAGGDLTVAPIVGD